MTTRLSGCPVAASKSARVGNYAGPKLRDCVQLNARVSGAAKDKLIELRESLGISMGDLVERLITAAHASEHPRERVARSETWWEQSGTASHYDTLSGVRDVVIAWENLDEEIHFSAESVALALDAIRTLLNKERKHYAA